MKGKGPLAELRTQLCADPSADGEIARPLAGRLREVASWAGDGALVRVRAGDPRLAGLDDDAVLMRGRAQAILTTCDEIGFEPIELAGVDAEVAVSARPHLGACLLESLAHADPGHVHVVAPVSWRHWILHAVTDATGADALAAIRALAETLLARAQIAPHERLGTDVLWWPGNRAPEALAYDERGAPAPTAAMIAMMPGWR